MIKTIQTDLDGVFFEDISIRFIKHYEPQDGYYLAFSGGKDSIVIHDLAVRAGVKFDAHFTFTTLDPQKCYNLSEIITQTLYGNVQRHQCSKSLSIKAFPPPE